METNKEKVIKELRRVFCAPCTTANSCVGCLVDIAEEAVNASQQSVQADKCPACDGAKTVLSNFGGFEDCVACGGTGIRR